jgi:hypothetical protein
MNPSVADSDTLAQASVSEVLAQRANQYGLLGFDDAQIMSDIFRVCLLPATQLR